MKITSTVFIDNQNMPKEYSCEGDGKSPPLTFSKVPEEAKSLALIVDDPDAPSGTFTHWVVFNIPPSTLQVLKNDVPKNGLEGLNSKGKLGYTPPCPPEGTHHYRFKLFALIGKLNLEEGASREEVEEEMKGLILESSEIIGLYKKSF